MNRAVIVVLLVAAAFLGAPLSAQAQDPTPPAGGAGWADDAPNRRGMVVSGHPEASKVGLAVLRRGGNAVDAAVAVAFALAAVSPDAGNLGGGGFLVLRRADGTATSWDFREQAPNGAWREMYAGRGAASSTVGHLAVGVPGTVAGLAAAHAAHGSLPWAGLVDPAVRLAEVQVLTGRNAVLLNQYRDDFARFPSTAAAFTKPDEEIYVPGERFEQPDLARTLARIRDRGAAGFYQGETADLVVAEMERGGGLVTHADLRAYRAVERPLVETDYRGYRVRAMGPPSSGGVALVQSLEAIEPYPLGDMGFHSASSVHLVGEALRRAFADRAEWLGDPDAVDVPTRALTDSAYVAERMRTFDPARASASLEVGAGTPPRPEGTETTHVSVVDAEGNAVAMTVTLNDYFGSKVVVGGAGFFLNDEMDDFTSEPGRPNLWGLVQGERNAVAPGRRMVSSMTPVVVDDAAGRLFMVAGSPGGSRIISTVLEVLTNVVDFGLGAQEAVSRPRFHHQWLPDELEHEDGLPEATLDGLRERGWALDRLVRFGAANVVVVRYGPDGARTLEGGADPRRTDDDARGF